MSASYGYEQSQLEQAIGCYAFGLKNGKSLKPWYFGMTIAERGFRGEVRRSTSSITITRLCAAPRTPLLFLMPVLTPEGISAATAERTSP